MPKNKKPNRKPGVKKTLKRVAADGATGGLDNSKPEIAKTYGSTNSGNTKASPTMTQRSARSR